MKFQIDHDYHIHSMLSSCSSDPQQTKERILQYAKENGLKQVCVTDHFWDSKVPGASNWYKPQNFEHISQNLPLPQDEQVKMYFGCETDMDRFFTLGIARETIDQFDLVLVPTTHLHMMGVTLTQEDDTIERRSALYVKRLKALLAMDLPFRKMGLAHPTCTTLAPTFEDHIKVVDAVSDADFEELFTELAKKGMGLELNMMRVLDYTPEELERILRPYRIAKKCGCKFYLGCDAHHPAQLDAAREKFAYIIDHLELTEEDKFRPFG